MYRKLSVLSGSWCWDFSTKNGISFASVFLLIGSEIWYYSVLLSSVLSLSRIWLFATPWTAARQASLSSTVSQSLLKLMSIESVMPSNHLILCHPLSSCLQSFPASGSFPRSWSHIKWPKYWSFNFSISPYNEYSGVFSFRIDWFDLAVQGTLKSLSNTTVQKHQFFSAQLSL